MARLLAPSPTVLAVPSNRQAPRKAREFVQDSAALYTKSARDAAVLMVSELVTNAVVHGRPPIVIMIERQRSDVRVSVVDDHPGPPTLQSPSPEAASGRGLLVVDALASAWGVQTRVVGKAVWFVVPDGGST